MSTPERLGLARACLQIMVAALIVRMVGAIALGEGAPFGPDGTGAQASVALGGHPYPLHTLMLSIFGADARALSMLCGALNCVLIAVWGRRVGLGMAGGWLAVFAPLSVMPGVLAAGDAPALTIGLSGIVVSTMGRGLAPLGGALAVLSVAVKPIALPVLVLLAARPTSLLGAAGALIIFRQFITPLWSPMPHGGLLGTWWVASGGAPPEDLLSWAGDGLKTLIQVPLWAQLWWVALGALAARGRDHRVLAYVAVLPLISAWMIAAMFGGRVEERYFSATVVAALPFVAAALRDVRVVGVSCGIMAWSTAALLTQLGATRAIMDTHAQVPALPILEWPAVETEPIFNACSTEDATRMRQLAIQLAEVAPAGSTIITEPRPDGREGELFWPLQVLRPDLKVSTSASEPATMVE